MIRKAFAILIENRIFAVALLISILLHLVLMSNWIFNTGHPRTVSSSFTVLLVKPDTTKQMATNPKPDLKNSQNNTIQSAVKLKTKTQSLESLRTAQSSIAAPVTTATTPIDPHEEQATSDATISQANFHTPPTPATNVSPNTPSIRQVSNAYQYVETEFETVQTTDPTSTDTSRNQENVLVTSKVVFIKNVEKNAYQLTSSIQKSNSAETTQISSEGEITAFGLRPNRYARINNGGDGGHASYADFYWADGMVEEYDAKSKISKKLSTGTQDELSFLYQFMFTPPTLPENHYPTPNNQIRSPHELAQNANTYSYVGEEILQTNLGELKTIHILKKDSLIEDTELWLAIEYNYLPVKIRKKDKSGLITEQIATKISLTPPISDSNSK